MRSLDDDNIVKYKYRINERTEEKLYIVMEFCEKGDLKQFIDKRKKSKEPISEEFIWNLLTQMLLALDACHSNKERVIIHRDIKPGNIFIDRFGQFKLGDFGLSKELSESSVCAKTNLGTPYYMSPEQVKGSEYDQKWDIWSLGCIIHEMASLEVPFKAENYLRLAEVISKGIKSPIPDRYSEDLQKFIDILMHKDPRHRPSADKLLYHPRISECLTNINLKKRINLKIEKEEFIKRQKEVFLKEQKLRHKERELERLNSKYLKRVKELKELEKNLERRHSKMKNLATNPDFSRNMKGNDLRKLNKTVDQAQDMSVINGSQERHIDTSLKVERMSYDLKEVDYNIENINTSNRNLLSSTSSYSANNYKNLSSHESKNLSSSNNFDDSQKDINSSLTKRPGQIRCELYGKNVKINLCNDDNSNGSTENYKAIGSNCLNNDSRDKIHSLMTRDTATIVAKKVKNALENHMATKERSFETNTLNTTRGLPPSGQKQIQRTSLEVAKQTESNSGSNPEGGINLSRNYSTNFLQNANNDEGSRNRLGNRKSIPVSFRTNSVENLHAAQNIQWGNQTIQRNLIPSHLSNMKVASNLKLKKTNSTSIAKPPMRTNFVKTGVDQNILKNFKKFSAGSKNSLTRKNFKTSSSTTDLKINGTSANSRDGFLGTGRYPFTNVKSIATPKEMMVNTFELKNTSTTRRPSIESRQKIPYRNEKELFHKNGSVTNRTTNRPFGEDDSLMIDRNMHNPSLNSFMKRKQSKNH